jgi:UDP-2,3-diacylglucosamine hydrolase
LKIAFISDLHLSPNTHHANQIFAELMVKWQTELDALYILGDFFDYWLGDDDSNDFIINIKNIFKQFTQHKPIYFITGNHDFGLGKVFVRETGIIKLRDCSILTSGNDRILLSHGDIFCSLDIQYQRMKKILQNPVLMAIGRKTPLSWRYKLKEFLEHKSAKSFNSKPAHTYHIVDDTVTNIAKKLQANIVIHGHTHRPGKYEITKDEYTVNRFEIPDWADRNPGGYILLEDGKFRIHYQKS